MEPSRTTMLDKMRKIYNKHKIPKLAACYNCQHKPNFHNFDQQRYVSPTTGKCKPLKVQSTHPASGSREVAISSHTKKAFQLAAWLMQHSPFSITWFVKWLWLIICVRWPWGQDPEYTGWYKEYLMEYWGQLWAARSGMEYSKCNSVHDGHKLELSAGAPCDVKAITRASYPRQLIVYDDKSKRWSATTDKDTLIRTKYLAISYRQTDFPDKTSLEQKVRSACRDLRLKAYWLDFACTGQTSAEKNLDLYRIADVFRGASKTLIMISDRDLSYLSPSTSPPSFAAYPDRPLPDVPPADMSPPDTPTSSTATLIPDSRTADVLFPRRPTSEFLSPDSPLSPGWLSWGNRVWTLPEALLSQRLFCKVGDGKIRSTCLREVAHFAYTDADEEMTIINSYSGKDPLERIERLTLLKKAIWKRSSGPDRTAENEASTPAPAPVNSPTQRTKHIYENWRRPTREGSQWTAYPAEKVYALMGFFEHRIMPDNEEPELHALARLSMANDSDRIAERMVGMLPDNIRDTACWYSDHDVYGTNLWDIEPVVQVAGVAASGALVLDGCCAAAIRWKDFPAIAYDEKWSFRRETCKALPTIALYMFTTGISLVGVPITQKPGLVLMGVGLLFLLFTHRLLIYSNSGRITQVQPWLIGVKGVLTAKQASAMLYDGEILDGETSKVEYPPTGSILACPETADIRTGNRSESEFLANKTEHDLRMKNSQECVYTLVDTVSQAVYHFTARKPPTVCVFVGREGGLGRYILCSETCELNELHKETVLRMPTYVSSQMRPTGWLAIGGA